MYSDFYGFTRCPFQATDNPDCYFESLSHRRAMTWLGDALAEGDGFVLLGGNAGAGKTALVAQFLATIDHDGRTIARLSAGGLDGGPTMAAVARAFALLIETPHAFTIEALLCLLRDEVRVGRHCLLIVEDAQDLSIAALESLRQLSNFKSSEQPLLQILLVGRSEFHTRLQCDPDLEPLRRRVIATHQIDPLQPDEVQSYVYHRLQCVGWHGNPCFDPAIFAEIHAASSGVPARINDVASRLLSLAAAGQCDHIDGSLLSKVLAVGDGGDREAVGPVLITGLEAALTRCEEQIAELQQTVGGLVDPGGQERALHRQYGSELQERLGSLESRVIEQERTIRHTLTMLIEWIERDEAHGMAA